MKQKSLDAGREGIRLAEFFQFADEFGLSNFRFREFAGPGFDKEYRPAVHSGEGRAADIRMLVENSFGAYGIIGAASSDDAMIFSAAEPQPAFGVEISHIAHAMPAGAVGIGNR